MEEQNNNNININNNNNNKLKRDGIIVILVICILIVTAAMIVVFGTQGEGRASLIKKIFNTEKVQEVEEPKENEVQPEEQTPEQNEVVEEEKQETKTEEKKTTKKSNKTNKTTNNSSSTTNKPSSGGSSGSSSGSSSGTTKPQGEKVVLYAFLDSDFLPNGKISRGEFAKWLVRINNNPLKSDSEVKLPFIDVPTNHKYRSYIITAYNKGYMTGKGEKEFDPDGTLTRAEVVTSVLKAMEINGIPIGESCEDKDYPDVAPKRWYFKAVHRATKACIIAGYDNGNFGPDDVIDKGHTFIIFYKAFNHEHKLYKTCDEVNEANPFATSVAGSEKYNLYLQSYFTHNCYK